MRSFKPKQLTGRALAAILVAAPLLIGGAHPATQVALSAALLLTALAYFRESASLRVPAVAIVAAIALATTAFQLLPLPAALVRVLSPRAFELRAEVSAAPPAWLPLTVDVPATVLELCKGFG